MAHPLLEKYAADGPRLAKSIEGLTHADLIAHPVPGTWSIQEIVFHMMDSDFIASDRMRRVASETNPLITGYDETARTKALNYEKLDVQLACRLFELNRQMNAAMLRTLPDSAYARTGIHTERGKISLGDLLEIYTGHLDHHLKFLLEKRRMLGKPLAGV